MTKIDIYNMEGKVSGSLELSEAVFGLEPNHDVIHRVVLNQLANRRQGTSKVKTRSEVRGGGKKPYRQKGTGRARQGSTRSAQHVGGGVIFGPVPRDYSYTLPKKMRRLAMKSALSSLVRDEKLTVVEVMSFDAIKTREMARVMKNLNCEGSTLIVLDNIDRNVILSANNIPACKTTQSETINVYDLMKYDKVLMTRNAVAKIEEVYAR